MKILLSLVFAFFATSLFGHNGEESIRPSWSGSWYNPDQSGHGISVEILDDERTVIYWYTYDLDGNPFWLVGLGSSSSGQRSWPFGGDVQILLENIRVEATAYYFEGMVFGEFDPTTNDKQEWGTIVLDFPYHECNRARMEWYPVIDGFSQGSTDLVRLTTPYGLDCVPAWQSLTGNWEVQFGFDAEHKYQVKLVAGALQDESISWMFEFLDETGCVWSGEVTMSWSSGSSGFFGEWGTQCGATEVEHSNVRGTHYLEHKLCDSENECVRKDEVWIFEDQGEYLIFSR